MAIHEDVLRIMVVGNLVLGVGGILHCRGGKNFYWLEYFKVLE